VPNTRPKISFVKSPRLTVGFNFDHALVRGIGRLNRSASAATVDEVFGAMPDSPIASARPMSRIRRVNWDEFTAMVRELDRDGIGFNYLMNTRQRLDPDCSERATDYVRRLRRIGITRFTAGSAEICQLIKSVDPALHVTMSITRGIRSSGRVREAEAAGADALYLDGVFVNRDFALLRQLRRASRIEIRLYANMSCIAACPVVQRHYELFAGPQDAKTVERSDAYFAGCSAIKLRSPVEWIQMPWVRPEDLGAYGDEGVGMFKLADRLAPTAVLLRITEAYLAGTSPPDMFELMERNAAKYAWLKRTGDAKARSPIVVHSKQIPDDFLEHFRSGSCRSRDRTCAHCVAVAAAAVEVDPAFSKAELPAELAGALPRPLLQRAGFN
jgi:collagenase-like PrtC family protease